MGNNILFFLCTIPWLVGCKEDVVFLIYQVTIEIRGEGKVEKEFSSLVPGSIVTVTAFEEEGWFFTGWTGDIESMENPIEIVPGSSQTKFHQL